jgi:hypothetical protein
MDNSKLVSLLQTFDKSEFRAFQDFISSPFFNKKDINIRLYGLLRKQAKAGFPEHKIKREVIYKQLFGNSPYDERQLNHVISEVFRLAEQFISIQAFYASSALPEIFTAQSHLARKQIKAYHHQARKAAEVLAKSQYQDNTYYHQKFLLAELAERHYSAVGLHENDQSLQEATDYFDHYYLSQKLQHVCVMLDRQNFLPTQYHIPHLPQLEAILEQLDIKGHTSIEVYQALLKVLNTESSQEDFNAFRQILSRIQEVLPPQQVLRLYLLAINFCVNKIRVGQSGYAQELMHLYMEGIDQGILIEEGKLSPWIYKNIVKLGLGLKRLEWVEKFVKEYSQYLSESLRDDAYHFSLADLFFHKKDYSRALTELNKVEFSDIYYNLDAKATLLKIYYEQDETEALLSLLTAFRLFLKRQKNISAPVKASYLNFVYLLGKIHKSGHKQVQALEDEIKNTKALNARNWLLQQL